VDTYQSEDEQVAAIKKFIGDHGSKVLAVVILFIASVLGIQSYQAKQLAAKESASQYYSVISEATAQLAPGVAKLEDTKQKQLDAAFASLVSDYPDSQYTVYANFIQAKLAVTNKDYSAAQQYLQWVLDSAASEQMKALADLRLAQVLFAQGELEQALAIASKHTAPFEYHYYRLEGDILVTQGGKDAQALAAYQNADAAKVEGAPDQILSLKIESLTPADVSKLVKKPELTEAAAEDKAE